jgi:hypothetical protein
MKRLIVVVLVMMMLGSLFGVKVVMKDGRDFNGFVHGKTDDKIILFDSALISFMEISISEVDKIYSKDGLDITNKTLNMENFDNNINYDSSLKNKSFSKYYEDTNKKYKCTINPEFIILSVSLALLSWDYSSEVDEIGEAIKIANSMGSSTSHLKKEKKRKEKKY